MAQVMNEGKPLWSENGQWVKMPVPEAFKQFCCGLCVPCIAGQLPFLRGIPTGSTPLPQAEKDALCARMAGHWKIQQLGCDSAAPKKNIAAMSANSMVYTDMQIRGDSMFISGGMHNQTQSVGGGGTDDYSSQVTTAVVNKPQEQKIIPFRGPNGELYIDNIGSFIVGEEDGEMELNNGLGAKMLLQRGWKRSGLPNPNAAATCIGVVAPMVVVAPVIGVVAPVGATMQRNKVIPTEGESPAEKIASLKKLLDIGAINQEEFDQKKGALLAQM